MSASKNIKGRAPNAWNMARQAESEKRILAAFEGKAMSRYDIVRKCGMSDATVWRKVEKLLRTGQIVEAEKRIGANHCEERMFRLCDPAIGPIPIVIEKKTRKIEKVSRDPFVAAMFGECPTKLATRVPSFIHRLADDELEAA